MSGRAYVHEYGFDEAFGGDFLEAVSCVRDVTKEISPLVRDKKFGGCIAVVWGQSRDRMIDFFGYNASSDSPVWHRNSGIYFWNVKNGLIVPGGDSNVSAMSCEDGIAILAEESKYRRSANEYDYSTNGSKIEGLNPEYDFSVPNHRFKLLDLQNAKDVE